MSVLYRQFLVVCPIVMILTYLLILFGRMTKRKRLATLFGRGGWQWKDQQMALVTNFSRTNARFKTFVCVSAQGIYALILSQVVISDGTTTSIDISGYLTVFLSLLLTIEMMIFTKKRERCAQS